MCELHIILAHLPSSNHKNLCALLLFNKQSITFKLCQIHNEIQTINTVLALFNSAGAIALAPQFKQQVNYIFLFTSIVHNEHELTSKGRLFYKSAYSTT